MRRRQLTQAGLSFVVQSRILESRPVADSDARANESVLFGLQKLPQSLDAVKESLAGVGSNDQMGMIGKQEISLLPDGLVGFETILGQELAHAGILQTGENDGSIFGFCGRLHS